MKHVYEFFKKETAIAGTLILVIFVLNLLPDIIKWKNTPSGREYYPIHNNLIDYALYINYERQGLEGLPVQYDRFTTEIHEGKIVNPFYFITGRIWGAAGVLDPHIAYHTMRLVLGVAWMLVMYWYIRRSIQSKTGRILALFFVLYGTSFPNTFWSETGLNVSYHMDWWSELDPLDRTLFLPAHLMGHILLVITIAMYTAKQTCLYVCRLRIPTWLIGTLTGFFAGLFHTPSLLLPALLLPLFTVLTKQWNRLLILAVCIPVSALSFVILSGQFKEIPWIVYWTHERSSFAVPYLEYILALGPVVPLALAGIFIGTLQPRQKLLHGLWAGIGLVMVPLAPVLFQGSIPFLNTLPLSNLRFLQVSIFVPLSILASSVLVRIQKKYGTRALFGISCLLFFVTFIGYPFSMVRHIHNQFGGPLFQYPTKSWKNAVTSLEQPDTTKAVLSFPFAGCAIAMETNRTAYVCHMYSTVNIYAKTDAAGNFFQASMPLCDAYSFLEENRIGDIFYGYDEKYRAGDIAVYPFIKLTRDYGDTQIYTFTGEKPPRCP